MHQASESKPRSIAEQRREALRAQREQEDRERSLRFMKYPDGWPKWPLLPVKRMVPAKDGAGKELEIGTVFADGAPSVHVGAGIYAIATLNESANPPRTWSEAFSRTTNYTMHYASFESMVEDGWEVD